jgi:cytochrome c-type biogenesis protein
MGSTVGLITAFGAGLASVLSPCVAPLFPGYLTLISGSASGGAVGALRRNRLSLFWPSLMFVFGFSLVFITLGASASVFGDAIGGYKQTLTRVSGVVMIVMGLVVLIGWRVPFLMRERRFHLERAFSPYEVLLVGMAFGFGWTPCFGPFLASILVYTSTVDTVRYGTLLLTAYSLGLGLPFLMVGLGLGQTQRLIRWIGRHGNVVGMLSGATLVVFGVLFATGQMFRLAIASQRFMSGMPGFFG